MKNHKILIFLIGFLVLISYGCTRLKKPQAITERENWIASFHDSIRFYKERIATVESELSSYNSQINVLLDKFEFISNPRQVSGFYILKGWNAKLPFKKTSIYARLNENETIELIATLSGATFNKISVSFGNESVSSDIVPHDQAFNYRHNGYNTVCFSGIAADSVAEFIATHKNGNLVLHYLEGSKSKNFTIPENEKSMIADTWDLHLSQLKQKSLQKELWLISRKIDTYRRMLENTDSLTF